MAGPKFRQVADDLLRRIEEGEFDEATETRQRRQLPTEIELQEEYDVSRNTIRDAIKLLVGKQKVSTSPGRGTFALKVARPFQMILVNAVGGDEVSDGANAYRFEASLQGREADVLDPRVEILRASKEIADWLGIEQGDRVVCRSQERQIDGQPWSLQASYYPFRFVAEGADRLIDAEDIEEGVVAYLKAKIGIEQGGYRERVTARVPTSQEIEFFGFPDTGGIVIVTDRLAYDQDLRPMRLTNSVFPADRNHLYVEQGNVPPRLAQATP